MAKLHFYYSAMNAGKTTLLLQSNYNYRERGMNTLLLTPQIDNRFGQGKIASRIGLQEDAISFDSNSDLYAIAKDHQSNNPLHCILVDEAQFLSRNQVYQITEIVDQLDIPVLAYGLRTDFKGEPFEGSKYLLAWAESLSEIKTICHCGRKATQVLRLDEHGSPIIDGAQISIGGNDQYVSVCRKHYKSKQVA
ncbi:MAG: thymidine kinase [Gammaproteobacteria bacterium]|nr:thymidine kinase [Gammaproteobacteria bacterium]